MWNAPYAYGTTILVVSVIMAFFWTQISTMLEKPLQFVPAAVRWSLAPVAAISSWFLIAYIIFTLAGSFQPGAEILPILVMALVVIFPGSFALVAVPTLFAPSGKKVACIVFGILGWLFWSLYPILLWSASPIRTLGFILPAITMIISVLIVYRSVKMAKQENNAIPEA